MRQALKRIAKSAGIFYPLRALVVNRRQARELAEWERSGRPAPPPHLIKQRVLLEYANRFQLNTLVETGTYQGDMVEAMKQRFRQIYSIELGEGLHAEARSRFKKDRHVRLLCGDSGGLLGDVMNLLDGPALFWLDGHYSGGDTARGASDTPIYRELHHILGQPARKHVILIDDARCFGRDPSYPTLQELKTFISSTGAKVEIDLRDDIIRITPASWHCRESSRCV
jgi:hypothetical protein